VKIEEEQAREFFQAALSEQDYHPVQRIVIINRYMAILFWTLMLMVAVELGILYLSWLTGFWSIIVFTGILCAAFIKAHVTLLYFFAVVANELKVNKN
jgi:hypothetical protein